MTTKKSNQNQKPLRKTKVTLEIFYDEFSEFKQGANGKFDQIDERFDQIDERFDQNESAITNLYKLLMDFKQETAANFEKIFSLYERHDQENLMRDNALDRHEVMLKNVNKKVGLSHLGAA